MGRITQKDIILNHLQEHKSITSYESFDRYGILDLQKIINVLRKNYNIEDKISKVIKVDVSKIEKEENIT